MPRSEFTHAQMDACGILHRHNVRFDPRFFTVDEDEADTSRMTSLYVKQPLGDRGTANHTHLVDLRDTFTQDQLSTAFAGRRGNRRYYTLLGELKEMDPRGQHTVIFLTHDGDLRDGGKMAFHSSLELDEMTARKVVLEVSGLMDYLHSPFKAREGAAGPVHFLPEFRQPWEAPSPVVNPSHSLADCPLSELLERVARLPQASEIYRKADLVHRKVTGTWRHLSWQAGETEPHVGFPGQQLPLSYESGTMRLLVHLSVFLAYVDETAKAGAIILIPPILDLFDVIRRHGVLMQLIDFAATTRFGLVVQYRTSNARSLGNHLFSSLTAFQPYKA